MDLSSLARAYDRSADGYDERFRELQRVKYRAAAAALGELPGEGLALDAGAALGALGMLLRRGGQLAATLLAGEAPRAADIARFSALEVVAGPLPAGQDLLFVLRRP